MDWFDRGVDHLAANRTWQGARTATIVLLVAGVLTTASLIHISLGSESLENPMLHSIELWLSAVAAPLFLLVGLVEAFAWRRIHRRQLNSDSSV